MKFACYGKVQHKVKAIKNIFLILSNFKQKKVSTNCHRTVGFSWCGVGWGGVGWEKGMGLLVF